MPEKRVLLVEDEDQTRQQLHAVLKREESFDVLPAAKTMGEALWAIDHADPSIVVTDIQLPDGDGYQVITAARAALGPEGVILVISVLGNEAALIRALEAGADGYILKDAREPDLIAAIREAEDGGAPISAMMARYLLKHYTPAKPVGEKPVLTRQETRVLSFIARGYTYKETAEQLGVSPHTVPTHIKNIYRKLQVNSGHQAVMAGLKHGLIDLPS